MFDNEIKERFADVATSQQETAMEIERVTKIIRELGDRWAGTPMTSITNILHDIFKLSTTTHSMAKRMDDDFIEFDAFGYERGNIKTAVIVQINSYLRENTVEQLEETIAKFPRFFPDHADKKLYGIIACVHAPDNIKNLLRKKGIYLAVLHDEVFELHDFKNFTPKDFNHL